LLLDQLAVEHARWLGHSDIMSRGLQLVEASLKAVEAGAGHPNKMRVRGMLVQLDTPSNKPPNGAQGHRILVPMEVAKRRLKTLVGMGLNYSPDLDAHAQRRKVGVIDKAWIAGNELMIEGHVWKHDFPEAEKDLKQSGLGMSMELGEVRVDNPNADVWTLDDFQFLGATILWRKSAAYNNTRAIAARAEQRRGSMSKTVNKTGKASREQGERVAQIAAEAAAGAVRKGTSKILAVLETQTNALAEITAQQEEFDSRLSAIETGTTHLSADADDDVSAAGKKASSSTTTSSSTASEDGGWSAAEDDAAAAAKASSSTTSSSTASEDVGAEGVDKGDLDEEDTDLGQKAGHANEDAENRGSDGAEDVVKKVGSTVSSARMRALKTANKQLQRQLAASQQQIAKLEHKLGHKIEKLQAQVTDAAQRMSRRSLSPEITAMMAKANIDPVDMFRSGSKLSVAEVDGVISSSGIPMNPVDRVAWKQAFLHAGLMDEGRVERSPR